MTRLFVLLGVLSLAGAWGAEAADTPQAEVHVGYAYLWDDSFEDADLSGSFPLGWQASVNFNVNSWLGIVADVSGHYKSETLVEGVDELDVDLDVYAFHGGLRFSSRKSDVVTPYFQALAGATRGEVKFLGESESETDFSIQPGAGLVIRLSDAVGIGLGVDYRLIFSEDDSTNEFRAHAGLVFRLGRK